MKRIKKGLALLLSIVMIFGISVNAFAADATEGTIEAVQSPATPTVGEEFTVDVKITANTGFNATDFQFLYNSEVVEFLGFETEYDEDAEETVVVSDFTAGSLIQYNDTDAVFVLARTNNSTKTGTLCTGKFKAIAAGDAEIKSNPEKFSMTHDNAEAVTVTWSFSAAENLVVTEDVLEEGYTVSLTPDIQEKTAGENAEVAINIASDDKTKFNALYTELSYDTNYLTLATSSTEDYTITENNGKITIVGYGEAKELGDALKLQFTVNNKPENGTDVVLEKAAVDERENADVQDAPEANYGAKTATITVSGINVTIPDEFNGNNTVPSGADYTFEAQDPNYDYTFTATMGDDSITVVDNGDGTYTVENVTADLVIEIASKTGKSFDVEIEGAEDGQVEGDSSATYKEDYSFTVETIEGYATAITVTIDGTEYTDYTVEGNKYTIPGADVIGKIKITVTNTASEYDVTIDGTGAGSVTYEDVPTHGEDFTFTVTKEDGYSYNVTATMDGEEVEVIDNGDGTYTIKNVTGDLVITVEKTEETEITVEVSEYVKVDNFVIYLVTAAKDTLAEDSALAYDENVMYWSEEYDAYAYLVISDTVLTEEDAAAKVTELTSANPGTIDYSGDVNGTTVIDVNDAQLVYDIYNAEYQTFTDLPMSKFLRADVNVDKLVDVQDAAAVVNTILGTN